MERVEADVCVIGSGFGGSLAAAPLVRQGLRVVMIERGDWVERGPHNWGPEGSVDMTPHYNKESPYRVEKGGNAPLMGGYHCVGGPSVFYGCVSLRFRERDFEPQPEIVTDSEARWPMAYEDMEPWYGRAEQAIGIAGDDSDPTAPPRSQSWPQEPAPLSEVSGAIGEAARSLDLQPFRLPLAINYTDPSRMCELCPTCDTYACAVSAKNDLATAVLPDLIEAGLVLRPRTVVTRLVHENGRVVAAEAFDKEREEPVEFRARWFVLAAGALATPHLLLHSGLHEYNPAGRFVGRYLMRHTNAIVFGLFPSLPGRLDTYHKQLGIHDFYFGHPAGKGPSGKLGGIQQIHSPPISLVQAHLPPVVGAMVSPLARRMTGLLVMAEDQPAPENFVRLDPSKRDPYGVPRLIVHHRYSRRDLAACKTLAREARRVLRRAGAWFWYTHKIRTFSHAVGTVRMGNDPVTAPVAPDGHFRGVENLTISDGSVFPTAGGVNPSLTIAANALRMGTTLAESGRLD